MTDLEITKLCAEAMGFAVIKESKSTELPAWVTVHDTSKAVANYDYFPLHDDAQAMALVKGLGLDIQRRTEGWHVYSRDNSSQSMTYDDDLNRAICECVAKMHLNKEK